MTAAPSGACGRSVPAEETLARILPLRRKFGVTRCADVTGLDDLGVPVFCAVRPRGKALGMANGKGLTRAQALVGALMEALEVHHAENPPADLRTASLESLLASGMRAIDPRTLADFDPDAYVSGRYRTKWALAEDLANREPVWVPASAVYLSWPATCVFHSNGLASGNTLEEATLHALLELLERDAVASLVEDGSLDIGGKCRVIDPATIPDGTLGALRDRFASVGVQLVLVRVPSRIDVHTFWCALLDDRPFAGASMVRFGRATHLNPEYGALRAVLEAAQGRLSAIHGAREDVDARSYEEGPIHRSVAAYFRALRPDTSWNELGDRSREDPHADLAYLLDALRSEGTTGVYRVDMTRPDFRVPVVKLVAPGLKNDQDLF
ncbi:MAG: YcaO-like family protein [Polyangiaceae bacterium]